MYYSKYVIVVLFLHHHEQGIIVHHSNKGMNGAMHGLISIVKAFARSTIYMYTVYIYTELRRNILQ